jgi:GTPase SAR1 family protein
MWEKYYTEANAVIFVVDSSDLGRLDEAKETFGRWSSLDSVGVRPSQPALDRLFEDESLMKAETPLITFANKQDLSVSSFVLTLVTLALI